MRPSEVESAAILDFSTKTFFADLHVPEHGGRSGTNFQFRTLGPYPATILDFFYETDFFADLRVSDHGDVFWTNFQFCKMGCYPTAILDFSTQLVSFPDLCISENVSQSEPTSSHIVAKPTSVSITTFRDECPSDIKCDQHYRSLIAHMWGYTRWRFIASRCLRSTQLLV